MKLSRIEGEQCRAAFATIRSISGEAEPSRLLSEGLLSGSGPSHRRHDRMCDARIANIVETGAAMSGSGLSTGCGSTQDETRALRAAFEKIQLAEELVDRLLAHNASVEQAEQLTEIRSQISAILSLISARLQTVS
jgi:hypothetical protein